MSAPDGQDRFDELLGLADEMKRIIDAVGDGDMPPAGADLFAQIEAEFDKLLEEHRGGAGDDAEGASS